MIKTLMKSIRQYKKMSILSPILVASEVLVEIFIPFLMANIIDSGIMKQNLDYILRLGSLLIVITIVSLVLGAGASWVSSQAGAGFAANLRQDLFAHIQTFSFTNIDKFSTSSLVTRLTTDIANIQMAYQMLIRIAVRAPLMMIFSVIMAFNVSGELALIFVVLVPVLALTLTVIIKSAYPLFNLVFRRYDVLNRVVRENVRGIREVKTYVQEDNEIEKFEGASESIFSVFSKAQKIVSLNAPTMQFFLNAAVLLVSWFGAKLIVGGSLQTGELVSMYAYSNSILFSLNMLAMIITQIAISQASGRRIAEVLHEKSTIENPTKPVTEVSDGSIKFDHVSFHYLKEGKAPVLDDINLSIKAGEVIGIIGETGSGKSSLVSLIPRLYDPTQGTIEVGGCNVLTYDLKTLRDNVAMVLQNNVLFSGTIAENLRWGNENATDEEVLAASKVAHADDFVQELPDGYNTMIEQGGNNVSGGQKQRLTIARALLKKPKILILDDSTSAVDTATEKDIRESLRTQMAETTTIIISQRIVSIKDADGIIVMNHGKIEDIGTHDELIERNALYHDINQYQTEKDGE